MSDVNDDTALIIPTRDTDEHVEHPPEGVAWYRCKCGLYLQTGAEHDPEHKPKSCSVDGCKGPVKAVTLEEFQQATDPDGVPYPDTAPAAEPPASDPED